MSQLESGYQKHFKKAKPKSHSPEALLEILQRQVTRDTWAPGEHGWAGFISVHMYGESSVREPRNRTERDKQRADLQLFTEFYLNSHSSNCTEKFV